MNLKRLTEYWPVISASAVLFIGTISFYNSQAVADHNDGIKAHPDIIISIKDQESKLLLLSQEFKLTQEQNIKSRKDQEKKLDRLILVLDRVESKISSRGG